MRPVFAAVALALAPATASCALMGDPVLWIARAPGKAPIHLFGTLHAGVAVAELDPAVRRAFDASRKLVTESYDGPPPPVQELMQADGGRLKDQLSKKAWTTLQKELSGTVPGDVLERLKPGVAYAVLDQKYSGFETRPKMDRELLALAEKAGKPIEYFESPAQQSVFLERAVTVACLNDVLEKRLYRDGDADLERSYRVGAPRMPRRTNRCPEIEAVLTVERSKAWLPRLESYAASGGVFVAVGCLHLAGPDGLVELLRARGYEVERVKAEGAAAANH